MKERQPAQIYERNNVDMVFHIAREARQILGAMGNQENTLSCDI
jgi:hypothetical protein